MLLTIIIVSYNTKDLTLQTLESVWQEVSTQKILKNSTEVIVVDNNSKDDSVSAIKKWHKQRRAVDTEVLDLKVLEKGTNAGFAKANNQAIELSQGEYLLLLNSDTIVQPKALANLVSTFLNHPINERTAQLQAFEGKLDRLGIVASVLLNPDGSIQPQGGSFPTLLSLASHMLMLDDWPLIGHLLPSTQHTGKRALKHLPRTLYQQDWVGGTAMLIRRQVIDEIGVLDSNIFMYAEDLELCMRAKNHHWDIAIQPSAKITHIGMASSSSANALRGELKGYLYIWGKHKPFWQFPLAKALIKSGIYLRWLVFGTMGNTAKAKIYKDLVSEI